MGSFPEQRLVIELTFIGPFQICCQCSNSTSVCISSLDQEANYLISSF